MLCRSFYIFVCFFFQAEDGIRDLTVTGVQTCALPICIGALERGAGEQVQSVAIAEPPVEVDRILERPAQRLRLPATAVARAVRPREHRREIGRASCRERGEISGGGGSLKKKKEKSSSW